MRLVGKIKPKNVSSDPTSVNEEGKGEKERTRERERERETERVRGATSIITTQNKTKKRKKKKRNSPNQSSNKDIAVLLPYTLRWSGGGGQPERGKTKRRGKKVTSGDEERHVKKREETKNVTPEDARERRVEDKY